MLVLKINNLRTTRFNLGVLLGETRTITAVARLRRHTFLTDEQQTRVRRQTSMTPILV